MARPNIVFRNETGEIEHREMTDVEYANLLETGWTEEEVSSEE